VGSTPPAGSIPLISDKFSLRRGPDITSDKQCYLYVKAGTQLQTDGAQTDTRRADFLKNPPELSKTIAKENK
jgi:hypothetical protein